MSIVDDILQGRDLYVVLENRIGRKYVESYNLSTIVIKDDKFWAKFSNSHPPIGHDKINPMHSISYIYNNFCEVVCCMCLSMNIQRFCSSNSYSKMDFYCKGQFQRIWHSQQGGDLKLMENAVRHASRVKVVIRARDGFCYIVPVHTIEIYQDQGGFGFDTEFDGMPERIKNNEDIFNLESQIKKVVENSPPEAYIGTEYQADKPFFLTSFMISDESVCQRKLDIHGNLINENFEFESVEVLVEM